MSVERPFSDLRATLSEHQAYIEWPSRDHRVTFNWCWVSLEYPMGIRCSMLRSLDRHSTLDEIDGVPISLSQRDSINWTRIFLHSLNKDFPNRAPGAWIILIDSRILVSARINLHSQTCLLIPNWKSLSRTWFLCEKVLQTAWLQLHERGPKFFSNTVKDNDVEITWVNCLGTGQRF